MAIYGRVGDFWIFQNGVRSHWPARSKAVLGWRFGARGVVSAVRRVDFAGVEFGFRRWFFRAGKGENVMRFLGLKKTLEFSGFGSGAGLPKLTDGAASSKSAVGRRLAGGQASAGGVRQNEVRRRSWLRLINFYFKKPRFIELTVDTSANPPKKPSRAQKFLRVIRCGRVERGASWA